MGASLLSQNLRRLILYEPSPGVLAISHEVLSRLEVLLEQGRREDLLILFMREAVGMSLEQLQQFQAAPQWSNRVAIAHTIPREFRGEESWVFDPQRFQKLDNPTLLLSGSGSPDWAKSGTKRVQSALRASQVHILEGQGHIAISTAPQLVANEIILFLSEM